MASNSLKAVTALVPMKEYSERIPLKNIKFFAGKPLLCWVLEVLKKSQFVADIIVNTDSNRIKCVIKDYFGDSIKTIDRPKKLCGQLVSMNEIIRYDIAKVKGDYFLQTHTTNPLITTRTIDDAVKTYFYLIKQGFDSLLSVTYHNARFFTQDGQPINHTPDNLLRTQDIPPLLEENSNIYIFSREGFLKRKNRIGQKPFFYKMNKFEAIDIDYEEDFKLAELVYQYINGQI